MSKEDIMKKFILGFIVAVGLLGSSFVFARVIEQPNITWYVTDHLVSHYVNYEKTYDEKTNIVCYVVTGDAQGISCIKNN